MQLRVTPLKNTHWALLRFQSDALAHHPERRARVAPAHNPDILAFEGRGRDGELLQFAPHAFGDALEIGNALLTTGLEGNRDDAIVANAFEGSWFFRFCSTCRIPIARH